MPRRHANVESLTVEFLKDGSAKVYDAHGKLSETIPPLEEQIQERVRAGVSRDDAIYEIAAEQGFRVGEGMERMRQFHQSLPALFPRERLALIRAMPAAGFRGRLRRRSRESSTISIAATETCYADSLQRGT
jgi:hypothetical protein